MEQQDQRLLRGNLEERSIDYTAWQISANSIGVRYITKPIKYNTQNSVQSGNYYVDNRSLMRDEIYALGISGVFKDGTETPVFHIPGRAKNMYSGGGEISDFDDPFGPLGTKETNRKPPLFTQGWDSTPYNIIGCETIPEVVGAPFLDWTNPKRSDTGDWTPLAGNEVSSEDCAPFNKSAGETIERWVLYNTAYREVKRTVFDSNYTEGELAYWESSFDYPDTLSCDGERIFPTGKIRHHKMPDTTLEPHFISLDNDDLNAYILTLGLRFDLSGFITELQTRLGSDYNEIQGFKISRVKRERGNKSVLDKGISFRALEMVYHIGDNPTSPSPTEFILQNNLFNKHINVNRDLQGIEGRSYNNYDEDNVLPPFDIFSSGQKDFDVANFVHSTRYLSIHNPKSQFLKDTDYQYIKMEKELFGTYENWGDLSSWQTNENSRVSWRVKYLNYDPTGAYIGTPLPYFTNRLKYDDYFTTANENHIFDSKELINRANQDVYIGKIQLFPDISNDGASYAGGPKDLDGSTIDWNPGTANNKIHYYNNGVWQVMGGYQMSSISKGYYVSLKNYNPGIYNQLNTLTYYPMHSCLLSTSTTDTTIYGGDVFISQIAARIGGLDSVGGDSTQERSFYQCLYSYFVESEVNCKLRHEGYGLNNYAGWYYPYHGITNSLIQEVISEVDYKTAEVSDNDPIS